MKMGYGWTGKILRVDLSGRKWSVEPTEKYAERFIGGIGIGYKILWDEVGPEVGAFDPGNKLVFAPGPLTGTLAPGSGRMELVSKSPRSYPKETVTRSGMGGFWGAELKYAGYDALVLEGKSEGWVNLWVQDGGVEFRGAEGYVGEDTYRTQERLRKELGERVQVVCIGPAGEKLSRLAVILSETSFASGRSGFGAVMGSKGVKAVAVRGTRPVRVFDPERLIAVSKKVRAVSARHTSRERTTLILNLKDREGFINRYRKRNTGCFGCPLLCFAHIEVPGAGESAAHCISYFYHPQAIRYYGPSAETDQAVADGFFLANRLGLDTFEFWHMANFLRDLQESGSLDLAELGEPGSREFIRNLLEGVAWRRGIGDLLAEGCARAADRVKGGWESCGKYFPAYGSAAHGPVRNNPGVALLWALDSRCPVIDQHSYIRMSISYPNEPPPFTLPPEETRAISRKFYGSESAIDPGTYEMKPEAAVQTQNRAAVIDLLVLCDWVYPAFHSFVTPDRQGDLSLESQLLAASTGRELSGEELNLAGERVWNLARAIMVREGRTRCQDTLHELFFREVGGEKAVSRSELEKAKDRYYELRGWDQRTGWPGGDKLRQLNLGDVADELGRKNLLP